MEKIRIENLTFKYPLGNKNALEDVSLTIGKSDFVVVCGKSGCGKSTLLRHLKKSMLPYGEKSGNVYIDEIEVEEQDDRTSASQVGFVQQNPDNQLVTDKVWHELAFGLENLGYSNPVIKRRVAEMASYFGIHNWFRRNVSELSGGQKQLLNLASIMAMKPDLLILDEPTSQLDPIAAMDFLNTIYKINRDLGVTVVISEHRLENVFPMADKVIVLDQGHVLTEAGPREVAMFLSKSNEGEPHPMFYGMPHVMRIFADKAGTHENTGTYENGVADRKVAAHENVADEGALNRARKVADRIPLTIREGRLLLEEALKDYDEEVLRTLEVPFGNELIFNCDRSDSLTEEAAVPSAASAGATALTCKELYFRYQRNSDYVLRGLSINLDKGKLQCLLGGNGSGKSTLLKAMVGIVKPQRGSAKIAQTETIAMVPQNPQALFTEITVEEEMLEGMANLNIDDDEKVKVVDEMLKLMEIEHLRVANPYDLSGGEQQRLAIGKVMTMSPSILLLDEPTKGLDPFFKLTLGNILKNLTRQGTTIFMVSHDVDFCAQFGDKCALFFDGEISAEGESREFFSGNSFYTTTANQLTSKWRDDLILPEDVIKWLASINPGDSANKNA